MTKRRPTEKEYLRAYHGDAKLDSDPYVAKLRGRIERLQMRLREVPPQDGALRWLLAKDLASLRGMVINARLEVLTSA